MVFNIIIPTRERPSTLKYCLMSVLTQDYTDLNIIVSDNFSQDSTEKLVRSFSDERIHYLNTQQRLSMSENWEFALGHVKGGFVTILGDDDALLPGAISRVAELAKITGSKAISSSWVNYAWPLAPNENKLSVPLRRGYETRNGQEWLEKLMKATTVYPQLPFLYTGGFVDLTLINMARNPKGKFFCSMTPDVYSAIAIASVCRNYIYSYEPFTVSGISKFSNGASTLGLGKFKGPERKFFSENNIAFHPILVGGEKMKSIPVLVYEAYLQAEHLHKNRLSISLSDQMKVFLSQATDINKNNIYDFVDLISNKNNLKIDKLNIKPSINRTVRNFLGEWKNYFGVITVDASTFYAREVYSAAILANSIIVLHHHHRFYFLKKIIFLPQKAVMKIVKFLR